MSKSARARLTFWATPAVGVVGGLAYLLAASISGHPWLGVELLALMVAFSAAVVLASRRSETVRGLLDRRDERIVSIDLRATAAAGLALILAVLGGAVVELARGHSGAPYTWLAALAGVVYLGAVVMLRARR
jgi:hypothetical protein